MYCSKFCGVSAHVVWTPRKSVANIGLLEEKEIEVVIYSTNYRDKSRPDDAPQAGGSLQVGLWSQGVVTKGDEQGKAHNFGIQKLYVRRVDSI